MLSNIRYPVSNLFIQDPNIGEGGIYSKTWIHTHTQKRDHVSVEKRGWRRGAEVRKYCGFTLRKKMRGLL